MTCNQLCVRASDLMDGMSPLDVAYPHPDCPQHGEREEPTGPVILRCAGCKRTPAEIPNYVELLEPGESADDYVREEEGTLDALSGAFLCDPCYIKAGQPSFPFPKRWVASPYNLREIGL